MRILNVARGPLIDDEALEAALDSGKVGGAALDVFRSEPITEHPLFGRPNVIVTPHLGASTAEATDRAGFQAAEQVVAALTGGAVTTAVNVPAVGAEDLEVLGPFLPLAAQLGPPGRRRWPRAPRSTAIEVEYLGPHRRARHAPARRRGAARASCSGHTEEDVNAVNAPVDRRRSAASRSPRRRAPTRARLHRPAAGRPSSPATAASASSARCFGHRNRPHLLEAWGQRFNLQLEPHLAIFRYSDVPGHGRPRRARRSASRA